MIWRPTGSEPETPGIKKPMHYKNNRPAKNGDIILSLVNPQQPVVGVLFGAKSENGSDCNGMIAPLTPSAMYPQCACLKNCLHIDDIAAANIPDIGSPQAESETVPDKA